MRVALISSLIFAAAAVWTVDKGARAQDLALPSPEKTQSPAPSPQPSITPPPPIVPPGLLALPEEKAEGRPDVPEIPELDEGFQPGPVSPAAELQRKHLEWRRLRNAVQNDRDVRAALRAATSAPTDLEKRKLLGRYYDLFYDKMMARAGPGMRDYLLDRKREAVGTLPQPRVRPGVAMSKTAPKLMSPTPAPSATPLFSPPGISNFGR